MSKSDTTGSNGRTRERVELGGEPMIHPGSRIPAKQLNKAIKAYAANPKDVTPQDRVQLAIAEALTFLCETLGTAHYDAKIVAGLIKPQAPPSKESTSEEEIDF